MQVVVQVQRSRCRADEQICGGADVWRCQGAEVHMWCGVRGGAEVVQRWSEVLGGQVAGALVVQIRCRAAV